MKNIFNFFSSDKEKHYPVYDNSEIGIYLSLEEKELHLERVLPTLPILTDYFHFEQIIYNVKKVKAENFEKQLEILQQKYKNDLNVIFEGKYGEVSIHNPFHFRQPPGTITIKIQREKFNEDIIFTLLKHFPDFYSIFIFNKEFSFHQFTLNINHIKNDGLPTSDYKLIKDFTGDILIDDSKNPGRKNVICNSWLMAAWQMFFGKNFYTIVPKEKLLSFPDALEHVWKFFFKNLPNSKLTFFFKILFTLLFA